MFGALASKFQKHLVVIMTTRRKQNPQNTPTHFPTPQGRAPSLAENHRAASSPRQNHSSRHPAGGRAQSSMACKWALSNSHPVDLSSPFMDSFSFQNMCMGWMFCLPFNEDSPNAKAGGRECCVILPCLCSAWWRRVCKIGFSHCQGHRRYCSEEWITFLFPYSALPIFPAVLGLSKCHR